ncbi:MAG: hypothetical protein CM1200mP15_22980 [Dehalococcoidia bacterium]|nr:MAG: hypothetical protein CM1200mP15_22980 [Dehalococcoidia bacterium]
MTQEQPKITPPVPQPESDFYWEKCRDGNYGCVNAMTAIKRIFILVTYVHYVSPETQVGSKPMGKVPCTPSL